MTGSLDHPSSVAPRRLVVPLATSIGIAFGAVLYGFSVLITAGAAGGVFSSSVLSSAFGGSVLVGGIAAIPVGRWIDRAGVRPALATGSCLVGVGFVSFGLAGRPWQVLAVWWLLIGPGSAMVLYEPGFIAIQRWFTPSVRNRAAGTLTLIGGLAGPIFVPATTVGVELLGWRPTAAVLGVLVMVSGLVVTALLRVAPWDAQPRGEPNGAGRGDERRAERDRESRPQGDDVPPSAWWQGLSAPFVVLSIAMAALFAVLDAIQVHRIARFEAVGFATGVVAAWAAFASLASLPARFLVPRLADRFDPAKVMVVLVLALVPALALTIRGTHRAEMVGHFVLFGALFGATLPMRAVLMADRFAGPTFGALMGVQAAAIALGRSLGPVVVGWLRDATSSYSAAMVLLTVLTGASAVLLVVGAGLRTGASLPSGSERDGRDPPRQDRERRQR